MMRPPALFLLLPLAVLAAQSPGGSFRANLEEGRYLKVFAASEQRLREHPEDATAWAARSQCLSSFQRFAEARAAADKALALSPGLAEGFLARGLARAGEAIRQRDLGSLRNALGALDDLRAATEADPSLVPAWTSLGLAYELLPGLLGGSTSKALQCADRLGRLAPARGELLRGLILVEEKRWNDAEPCFRRALALAPQDPQVVAQWLEALDSRPARRTLGEAGKNARLLSEAARLLPGIRNRAVGVAAVSEAYLHGGQGESAWRIAQEGLGAVEAPSLLRLQLGKVAALSGLHREEGLNHLDRALGEPLEGGSAGLVGVWWRKGQILWDLGRRAEARQAAQEALKLDPRHRGARELLQKPG